MASVRYTIFINIKSGSFCFWYFLPESKSNLLEPARQTGLEISPGGGLSKTKGIT